MYRIFWLEWFRMLVFYLRRQFSLESGLHRVTARGSWMAGWLSGTGTLGKRSTFGLVSTAEFGVEIEPFLIIHEVRHWLYGEGSYR